MRLLSLGKIVLYFLLMHGLSFASPDEYIVIHELTAQMRDDNVRVDCEVNYQLSDSVKEALSNGIEMVFRLEIELMQESPYWLDNTRSHLRHEFKVKYHALSKQYVMVEAGNEVERSFPDLYSAFYFQRRLHNATLKSANTISSDKKYYIRARARLVSEELPLPLRIKSYISSSWRPSSGWTIWPI